MYSAMTLIIWCFMSMMIGVIVALSIILFVWRTHDEYEEPDDFPDEEWVKDYKEIKNGR